MEKERFQRLQELYHAVEELPESRRADFLAAACGDDQGLREEVEALLEQRGEGMLDDPPARLLGAGEMDAGKRLGPYEILGPIGAGGMGEVFRAMDTRLNRTVAIKVLRSHLGSHTGARERFEREARAVSSLNHPHVCVLHDVGSQGGIDFLVMEYLEGETLAARLRKGALPLGQALVVAIQIADALAAAHAKGLIHRDLKPANVMLTKGGAKLLDFGLAKKAEALSNETGTMIMPGLTNPGTILGTVQYMSPEQLEGSEVDARTDIFAFGALLYEMLTGKKAFEGKSQASIIAAIMSSNPAPISALQPLTPTTLERIVGTCLSKDPEGRWQSAHDLKLQLQAMGGEGPPEVPSVSSRSGKVRERAWMAAAALLLVAAIVAFFIHPHAGAPVYSARFEVKPPANAVLASLISAGRIRISPDGRMLAFVARVPGSPDMIWVRPLDSFQARALAGTEGAAHVFWSPDSRFIAFFSEGKLKKIEAARPAGPAAVQVICEAPDGRAGSWGRSDTIVFANFAKAPIFRVPAPGGVAVPAVRRDRSSLPLGYPSFLPDGRHFLFHADGGIYVAALDSPESTLLSDVYSSVEYALPGYLLFVRGRSLMAQPFDATHLKFTGAESTVESHVGFAHVSGGNFSVSENGTLAFGTGDDVVTTQMVWFDRAGKRLGTVDQPGAFRQPQVSGDGSKLVVERLDFRAMGSDIWRYDLARDVSSRLTFGPGWQFAAVGSPDMSRIAYTNAGGMPAQLVMKSASGAADPTTLRTLSPAPYFSDWSRDGRFALFIALGQGKREDLWVLPVEGDHTAFPFLATPFSEEQGQFSPDGKWIAYASDETGKPEVYVQSFPATGAKWLVSTNGGTQPRWRGDGKEIFYLAADGKLIAVPVKPGARFEVGSPAALFPTRLTSELGPYITFSYAVTGDGQRFLLLDPVGDESLPAMSIVLNWTANLSRSH